VSHRPLARSLPEDPSASVTVETNNVHAKFSITTAVRHRPVAPVLYSIVTMQDPKNHFQTIIWRALYFLVKVEESYSRVSNSGPKLRLSVFHELFLNLGVILTDFVVSMWSMGGLSSIPFNVHEIMQGFDDSFDRDIEPPPLTPQATTQAMCDPCSRVILMSQVVTGLAYPCYMIHSYVTQERKKVE